MRYTVDMTATRHIVEVRAFHPPGLRVEPSELIVTLSSPWQLLMCRHPRHFSSSSQVGSSETVNYDAGAGTFKFHTAGIELEGIKKR